MHGELSTSSRARQGASTNGDAAVRSSLEVWQDVRNRFEDYFGRSKNPKAHFNITADGRVDDHDSITQHNPPLTERDTPLLYSLLPLDLPNNE